MGCGANAFWWPKWLPPSPAMYICPCDLLKIWIHAGYSYFLIPLFFSGFRLRIIIYTVTNFLLFNPLRPVKIGYYSISLVLCDKSPVQNFLISIRQWSVSPLRGQGQLYMLLVSFPAYFTKREDKGKVIIILFVFSSLFFWSKINAFFYFVQQVK